MLIALIGMLSYQPMHAQQETVNVLYISNLEPPVGGDELLIATLDSLGYNVTAIPSAAYNEFSHIDNNSDMIVFGESLGSGAVLPFSTADFPVPCVSLEGFCVRENRWALVVSNDDFGQILPAASLPPVVSDPTKHFAIKIIEDHPISLYAGLQEGDEVDWSSQRDLSAEVTYFTLPQASATIVADIKGETDLHTLYAIEPDENDASNPLNHRLVIWGVHENGLLQYNSTFVKLIDGAILWTMGLNSTSIDRHALVPELRTRPNPFRDQTEFNFSLQQAARVTLEVMDLAGRRVDISSQQLSAGEQRMTFQRPAHMSDGLYYFTLSVEGRQIGYGKIVAE